MRFREFFFLFLNVITDEQFKSEKFNSTVSRGKKSERERRRKIVHAHSYRCAAMSDVREEGKSTNCII